jgi:hypothetical protein
MSAEMADRIVRRFASAFEVTGCCYAPVVVVTLGFEPQDAFCAACLSTAPRPHRVMVLMPGSVWPWDERRQPPPVQPEPPSENAATPPDTAPDSRRIRHQLASVAGTILLSVSRWLVELVVRLM